MISSPEWLAYSFSMINLVKLLPDWSWEAFDQVMSQTGTTSVELVPSMFLGADWDQQIKVQAGGVQQSLERLMQRYKVKTIQSLTYGLQINLVDQLINHPEMHERLKGLGVLGKATGCSVLILGSPGQKKLVHPDMSNAEYKLRFIGNCSWMASTLGPEFILSLEHNTIEQGAEYCNTLGDLQDIITTLRHNGQANVGLNLDTKCLLYEFGKDVRVGELLAKSGLAELVTSIQVSYDFLTRDSDHRAEDHRQLIDFAHARDIPLSLEEFGLLGSQLTPFVNAMCSLP